MSDEETNMQVNNGAQGDRIVRVSTPSNSNKTKDEQAKRAANQPPEKKVNKIVTGEVTQRKKGLGRKIADTFTGDNMHSVGQYILHEVVIPQIKTLISDAVSQGVDKTMWGDTRRSSGSSGRTYNSGMRTNYTSYNGGSSNRYSSPAGRAGGNDGARSANPQQNRSPRDFTDIVLDNRGEAEEVLDMMGNLINQYEFVTVSDLYDLVGITGAFTDEKWGWAQLNGAHIRRVGGGFLLDLPRPVSIDG